MTLTPQPTDATLGNNTPAPRNSGILGGIDGIHQKLTSTDLSLRLEALDQAWTYGDAGKACLESMLTDNSKTLRRRARWLLRQPEGTNLTPEPVWNLTERLSSYSGYGAERATHFANRTIQEVQEFHAESLEEISPDTAYALRCEYDGETTITEQLEQLLSRPNSEQIEAIVIGLWDTGEGICTGDESAKGPVGNLVAVSDRLPNLKAIFIGDIASDECEISWLVQSDMSPLLQAYPRLEVLQVRGGEGLTFADTGQHDHLRALILETGGLRRETVHQIYTWQFPALEHLELWFGVDDYGGDCSIEDLKPVLEELHFPNLAYLGLRNSPLINELIDHLVRSPILAGLQVLDLSLGTLGDEGAAKLLGCEAINDLETLNVSESFLSGELIDQLNALSIQVVANNQQEEDDYEEPEYRRYCSVTE